MIARRLAAVCVGLALVPAGASAQQVHRQVVAYFFSSQHCPVSNSTEVRDMMRAANKLLKTRAETQGYDFGSVGVATDVQLDSAWTFIRSYDSYNEVIVGREFFNTGVMRVMVTRPEHVALTPQVVVVLREIHDDSGQLTFGGEHEVLRLDGRISLAAWLESPHLDLRSHETPRDSVGSRSYSVRRR